MSILNAWCTASRALIGVDTEARKADGSVGYCSKMVPLVGPHAVLALRGDAPAVQLLAFASVGVVGDFDAVDEAMPTWLQQAPAAIARMYAEAGATLPTTMKQEVVLCGWSARRDRVVGRLFEFDCASTQNAPSVRDIEGAFAAPWDASIAAFQPSESDGPDKMARLARAQARLTRRIAPGTAAGGRFVLCELDRERMRIWTGTNLDETEPA